jgi:hypothetical protein
MLVWLHTDFYSRLQNVIKDYIHCAILFLTALDIQIDPFYEDCWGGHFAIQLSKPSYNSPLAQEDTGLGSFATLFQHIVSYLCLSSSYYPADWLILVSTSFENQQRILAVSWTR